MTTEPFIVAITSDRWTFELEEALLREETTLNVRLKGGTYQAASEIATFAADAHALLPSSRDGVTREVVACLKQCLVIGHYGAGFDNIDLDAATQAGIIVTHFPSYCSKEVADHTLALVLALNRRIVELDRDLRRGVWVRDAHHTLKTLRGPVWPLSEQTIGVIGCGRIGRLVVQRALAFDMTVLVHDPFVDPDGIRALGATPVQLPELLERSQIVTLHCPLDQTTRGMVDGAALARMRPDAVLVNAARGKLVQTDALVHALTSGIIAGAAIDVVDQEPLPLDHPLYSLENVILTPHCAYYSEASTPRLRRETLRDVLAVFNGRLPRTVANPDVLSHPRLRASIPR